MIELVERPKLALRARVDRYLRKRRIGQLAEEIATIDVEMRVASAWMEQLDKRRLELGRQLRHLRANGVR